MIKKIAVLHNIASILQQRGQNYKALMVFLASDEKKTYFDAFLLSSVYVYRENFTESHCFHLLIK